jgi:hypothetical protein
MEDFKKLRKISKFVRENGELTNKAQSCWGADRWELTVGDKHITFSLEDDGYTQRIISDGLNVSEGVWGDVKFINGTSEILKKLFNKIGDALT